MDTGPAQATSGARASVEATVNLVHNASAAVWFDGLHRPDPEFCSFDDGHQPANVPHRDLDPAVAGCEIHDLYLRGPNGC
jgi:hypothetical protein